MEFHISRQARDRYQFDQPLFALNGNVVFANFHAARVFAQKINQNRDLVSFPEQAVKAGQINALGLIDEILHYVISLYRSQKNPQVMSLALETINSQAGKPMVDKTLAAFAAEYPPLTIYRKEMTPDEYLEGSTDGIPNRQVLLEEMLMLWIENRNPATQPFQELFDDKRLSSDTAYARVISSLDRFLKEQPPFGPEDLDLVSLLRAPSMAVPHSLTGQLEYIRERWGDLLGRYLYRLLSSLDLVREEEKAAFMGPGPTMIPIYDLLSLQAGELEYERFSPDKDWMPRLVLIAKNTYVWLDQLSKKFKRAITTLDQIPDEELAELAARGFTGLWLIGLWERSKASAEIKKLCGNPDALASAYSLYNYDIAHDLGGEAAYASLRDRAWRAGIRLASDMVPNHMGIDSNWVVDHPDWFVQLDTSPFPSYSFNGPDLNVDPAVSIHIEDHYFDRTDAGVVFKYYDQRNGQTRFIYHGNDGTSMPWNDTAQLNYLNPAVREGVIQTILSVARRFPIIRFDAAMTLAKKHYQRLWFPEPGTGGAIASRAEQGLTREQFNAAFPVEFWREVVDRVANEAPDTLLLAEAFWMMEGYFVRTLGMHRVYNSAFMNMLRNEENAKYRTLIKNTLEFDPDILKRYVNFMNNPDERTAVDQFGKGDKYFGICVLMATLPGLPMFGHGQLEGFAEKYGMEFRHALWEEQPDPSLVDRHLREISPLLHRRSIFAGVENFLLYDFYTPGGWVDENVLAYSNSNGSERGLVMVHNRFESTEGWMRMSTAFVVKGAGGDRPMIQRSLAEGLGIHGGEGWYAIARDQASGLEYLFSSQELANNGIRMTLNAYEYHVFLDFHEVQDDEWGSYRHLYEYLGHRGVPDVREALRELVLQPVLNPFREIANPGYFNYLSANRIKDPQQTAPTALLDEAAQKMSRLLDGASQLTGFTTGRDRVLAELRVTLNAALSLSVLQERFPVPGSRAYKTALKALVGELDEPQPVRWTALLGWLFLRNLGKLAGGEDYESLTRSWIDEWHLARVLEENAQRLGLDGPAASRAAALARLLTEQQEWIKRMGKQPPERILETWLADLEIQSFMGVNRYKEVLWFNKEAFEEFAWWMNLLGVLSALTDPNASGSLLAERVLICNTLYQKMMKAAKTSDYQVAKLLKAV